MENKCGFPRKDVNSGPTIPELTAFASKFIVPALASIKSNKEYYVNGVISPTKARRATIQLLQGLGKTHVEEDHKYIAQAFEMITNNPMFSLFETIIPQGFVLDLMEAEGTSEQIDKRIFTDSVLDDDSEDVDAVDYFLHKAYSTATAAKNKLQRKMMNSVLNSFVVNRSTGTIIPNIEYALKAVEANKKQLLSEIQAYFKKEHPTSKLALADLTNMSVSAILDTFKLEIAEKLQVGTFLGSRLLELFDDAYNNLGVDFNTKTTALLTLNAYGAWVALQHYDNFIKMTLGDTIIINPSSETRYSYSEKGTNVNTTWRKDDNIDLQAEINKLTQALINTSPLVTFGTQSVVSDGYLQFSDFSYITAKIKDLAFDPSASTTYISEKTIYNFDLVFSEDEKRLIKNKSFRHIISSTRYNPQKYLPIIYKILTAKSTSNKYFIENYSDFNSLDKTLVWSIYKNMYDTDENGMNNSFKSMYSIQKSNPKSRNYYAAVSSVADCIFSVDFIQYMFEDGAIKLRTLRDAAVDKTRWEIENIINTKNSPELVRSFNFNPYNIQELNIEGEPVDTSKAGEKMNGITFQLNMSDDISNPDVIYVHVLDMGDNIVFSRDRKSNGKSLTSEELKELYKKPALYRFLDETLGLNLGKDAEFRTTYLELVRESAGDSVDDITPFVDSVLKLASHVFLNRYFSNTYLSSEKDKRSKIRKIEKYYTKAESRPRFNGQFFNMNMIPRKKHNTLVNLAQALSATRGLNSSRQVKDSDNAMLSSQTLSRLLGNLTSLLDMQIDAYNKLRLLEGELLTLETELNNPMTLPARRITLQNDITAKKQEIADLKSTSYILDTDQNPAAAKFDLVTSPGLFKGMLKSEEIKGLYGNKKQVKFTTAEAVMSSFLHNFVLGHCSLEVVGKYSKFGGGVVGLLPSVNSDKTTVSIAQFDLNAFVRGTSTRYSELEPDGIRSEIRTLIGAFYDTMYSNVESDFKTLSDFARSLTEDPLTVPININSGFSELNYYVDTYNANLLPGQSPITAALLIFDYTNRYNKQNPTKPLRIIDQIHYVKSGNHVAVNSTIKALKNRFATLQATDDFFNLKSTEVLKSALDSGFVVNLYGDTNLNKQPEIEYLRQEKFKAWCKEDTGQMVLAKIRIGEVFMNVASKQDLLKIEDLLTIEAMINDGISNAEELFKLNKTKYKKDYGFNNLINNIHKLKDRITLHPMLDKYNLFDYLFTQQLMSSTVGSHVAHPAKVKRTTPIIWGHPALGKTYALNDPYYKTRILDWDTQFNANRDMWISQRTGIPITDKRFKDARNEYTIRWRNHEDYKQFVTREWNRIKTLAKNENKILVASPHMLLDMFGSEFDKIITMSTDDFVKRGTARGDGDPVKWKEGIETTMSLISKNPVIASKITLVNEGEYFLDMLTSGKFDKELTRLLNNEMEEEASRFYAQHKRNVSFTASMDQFQLNLVDGIPLWYNIAIIDDIHEALSTIDGSKDSAKPFDGATFVNPIIMYLENNSLNEARAGIDKKQFVHYYDELTGSGGIIKTAGFALTNDRMRNAIFYRDMMENMTNRVWKDYEGNNYVADITKDYLGNEVDYGTFYYKEGNNYYSAKIQKATVGMIRQLGLTTESGIELDPAISDDTDVPNSYIRVVTMVGADGRFIKEIGPQLQENINTNYKLWKMFGGMHSQEMVNGKLLPSETSLKNVTKAVINTGKIKPGYTKGDITAEYIDQPLKNADIHYMPTIGAVKQGAANMNPNSYYSGKHDLNFFKIRMTNAGIQLDKEHHADGSKLSLMTLVISSACSMGFNPELADRLYKALHKLTMLGIKQFRTGFLDILLPGTGPDKEAKFEEAIAECMVKNMITSTALDGDMLRAIASDLIERARKGNDIKLKDTPIPYSDPAVFNKLVSNLSVIMTKAGIKAKMDGILSVLCPTNTIVKMYNFTKNGVRYSLTLSLLESMFGKDFYEFIDELQDSQPTIPNTLDFNFTNIEVGSKYRIKFEDRYDALGKLIKGYVLDVDVKFPHNTGSVKGSQMEVVGYDSLKQLLKNGHAVYGKVAGIQEYIKDGKELGSINYKFKGSNGKDYQIWDIDYIQRLFEVVQVVDKLETDEEKLELYKNLIAEFDGGLGGFEEAKRLRFISYQNGGAINIDHELKLAKRYAKQLQQNILFNLSKNNPNKNIEMRIEGDLVTVDKDSIEVIPYEVVMPKTFLNEFGLDEYSNLDEIIKNPNYFFERMRKNFRTKVLDATQYDLELKKANGKHIYLKDISGALMGWDRDLEKISIHTKVDELGLVWRVDLITGDKMYRMSSVSDEVYRIPGTDIEIIATSSRIISGENPEVESGLTFYLDNFKYQSLHVSDAIAAGKRDGITTNDRPKFDDLLDFIGKSDNKSAQRWLENFTPKEGEVIDKIALNKELNSFRELSPKLRRLLKHQASVMHTSLIKSLDIIAARIPAQNQQSFMPMRVVAWENPNVNTAYVSVMQFFLQGSDLDIDAVSLLTFSFSPSGEFYDWSPDFNKKNKDMLNLSMELPFPSGKKLDIVNYEKLDQLGEHVNELDRKASIVENEHFQALIAEMKRKAALPTKPKDTLEEEAYEKEELKHYIALLKDIERAGGSIYFNSIEEQWDDLGYVQTLIDRIDKHNLYLEKASDKTINGAIKNYVVGSLFSISTDAANLLEAHTGVDVATGPIKKIANKSELSEVQKTFTPGNIFNKFQAIEEASVGKDDIAICATGLKGFFAATQFCNSFLNEVVLGRELDARVVDELSSIVRFNEVEIGGRKFNSLANIRVDDLGNINPNSAIYQILKDKGFDDDASVIMSALLSLSTDNAKELCLAKINAGTSMIGMYLYGAAIGMDFKVMNKIIASPLGFTVAKLLNSNEFTLLRGKTSINAVLEYLRMGPSKTDLNRFKQSLSIPGSKTKLNTFGLLTSKIEEVLKLDKVLLEVVREITGVKEGIPKISEYNVGYILAKLVERVGPESASDFISKVQRAVDGLLTTDVMNKGFKDNRIKLLNFRSINNQMFDFFMDFINQTATLQNTDYVTEYGNSNIVSDLNKLALGADEFKRLGLFLRLNLEIKTKPDELINFVQKIETVITERAKMISDTNKRLGISNPKGLKSLKTFDFKKFAESFMKDPHGKDAYHNLQIELYERFCKSCINPLRVLTTVPHYKGYFESMILAYEGDYIQSTKFRAIKHLGNTFIADQKIKIGSEKTAVYRGVLSFIDDYINNAYLHSRGLFHLPKTSDTYTVEIIDSTGKGHVNENENTYILLGNDSANRTFEHFFETIFIPALKERETNNIFVKDLKDVLITDPISGVRYLATSLPINMMPSSDNERILFNKYKNDFNKIAGKTIDINGVKYNISEMFQYYNLLKFRGKGGRSSLLSIFEDIMAKDQRMIAYRHFIYNFDKNYDFAIGGNTAFNEETGKTVIGIEPAVLYKYLAPLTNPFATSAKIIKYKDSNTGLTVLLERKEEKKEETQATYGDEDGDYDADFGDFGYDDDLGGGYFDADDFDGDLYLEEDFDGEGDGEVTTSYKPNYGSYKLFQGDGTLTRFNPPSIIMSTVYDQIISNYHTDGSSVKNVIIKGGRIKQLQVDGKVFDIKDDIEVVKIRQVGEDTQYYVDKDDLDGLIKVLKCE